MSVEFKDYYRILDVPRTASQDDIKKAFRRLSRKYHPDLAEDKAAAEKRFKEINEAYQVLKDPEKRKKYDRLGADWEQADRVAAGGGQGFRRRRSRGDPFTRGETFHFGGTGFSDFFETFFGSMGSAEGDPFASGFTRESPFRNRAGRDVEADIMVTLEEVLRGSTRQVTLRREGPDGSLGKTETYQVRIPPGVSEGQRIRLAGQGEPGEGDGRAGHLFLRVRFAAHPDFRVHGKDLHHELALMPWEAVLGCSREVPTPTGRAALKIPPGTQNGRGFRLRGHGLPNKSGDRGDLYVRVEIRIPDRITEKERELWQSLARNRGESTHNSG